MVESDPIRIPIEVETEERKEVQESIKELKLLQKEKKKSKDTTSGQAVPTLEDQGERRGGIFGGDTGAKLKPKDRKSKQAVKKQNKLVNDVDDLKKIQKKINDAFGKVDRGFGLLSGGGAVGFITKYIPLISALLIARGFVDKIIVFLFKDGGIFDRRLKIFISKQFFTLTKRRVAKKLSEGYSTLRITSIRSLRGPTTQIFNPQQEAKKGTPILSIDLENLSKAVY